MKFSARLSAHDDDLIVRADPGAIEQILFNLVDNAAKYATSTHDPCVEVTAGRTGTHAIIRVRDHGPGIALVESRRLFQPFSKSAKDAANSAPGVGLGLALSRRLAREMKGELSLEPVDGPGACFVLTLPLATA
jgi:signal transduction histidine kinase